jgi:hypothetical protein
MRRFLPGLVAAAPGVGLALCSLWWSVGAPLNGGLWPPDAVSLPEAVLTRNGAEVVRLVNAGARVDRRVPVDPSLLSGGEAVPLTALEAAVWARDPALVRLLVASGSAVDAATLLTLRCLSERHPDAGVRAALERLSAAPWPDCSGVPLP